MKPITIINDLQRKSAAQCCMTAPLGWIVRFCKPTRTLSQNAIQWPYLDAFSKQLLWPVNGQMVKMTAEEWKDVLTASFKKETARLAMGVDGGVVMLGKRTSDFKVTEFSEWIGYLQWFSVFKEVKLPAPKWVES